MHHLARLAALFVIWFHPSDSLRARPSDTLLQQAADSCFSGGILRQIRPPYADSLLEQYFSQLQATTPEQLGQLDANQQLSFWLNVHHAILLRLTRNELPSQPMAVLPEQIDSIGFPVGGRLVSLRFIRTEIISKEFHDPRALFALTLPTFDYPILPDIPFAATTIDSQLSGHCRNTIQDRRCVTIDRPSKRIVISEQIASIAAALQSFIPDRVAADPSTPRATSESVIGLIEQFGSGEQLQELQLQTDWTVTVRKNERKLRLAAPHVGSQKKSP